MQREENLSNQIKCIRCNAVIVGDDRFCPECGAKVDFGLKGIAELESFFSTKPKTTQKEKNNFQCDFCSFKNKKGATFCEKCGGVLQVDVFEPEIIENKKDDESLLIEENVNSNLVENVTTKKENEEVEILQTEDYPEYQQEMLDVKQNIEEKFIEEKENSQTSRYNFYLVAVFLFLLLVFIYMFFKF